MQFAFQNYSVAANASTDLAIYNDSGTDSTHFIDMGIVSSTYDGDAVSANVFGANDGYLYVAGNSSTGPTGSGANVGNLIFGATTGQVITWLGNTSTANIITVVGPTGFNVSGIVSATGNIIANTGSYFIGNGSLLTGISGGGSSTSISNGTSNVTVVSSGGNVSVGVGGTGDVAVFATTGAYVTGVISASANVTGGNLLTGGLISATGNITGGNILTSGLISVTANVTANNGMFTNIVNVASHTGAVVSVSGNVTGGNILTAGLISATANVTGNYFIGNGSLLTGISGGGSSTSISNGTSNVTVVSSGGNVSVGVGGTGDVAVFATTGAYVTGLVSVSGNVIANNGMFTNIVNVASHTGAVVSVTANVTGGNIITAGLISAAGNVDVSGNVNIGNADSVSWANATGIRAYVYYNNNASSLDTVFL